MPVMSAQKERPQPAEARGLRWVPMRHVSLWPHPPSLKLGFRDVASPAMMRFCACYFQKSLNLSSGDISVCRGPGSRTLRLDTLCHVTPSNAPPTTTATSMVTRLKFSIMGSQPRRMGSETHLYSRLMVPIGLRRTHRSDTLARVRLVRTFSVTVGIGSVRHGRTSAILRR